MRKANWILVLLSATACANAAMKTVDAPGGKIVYGAVDGQTTEAAAMGAMLKNAPHPIRRPSPGRQAVSGARHPIGLGIFLYRE